MIIYTELNVDRWTFQSGPKWLINSHILFLYYVKAVMILNVGIFYLPYKKHANVWC